MAQNSMYGSTAFTEEEKQTIQTLLEVKLDASHLATRPGPGSQKLHYVESWKAIELANSIFGFTGWSSSVVDVTPDYMDQVAGKMNIRVGVTAVVRVTLKDGTFHEDVGYGTSENRDKGKAIEHAKKEAVSDARKRALKNFGNALGNCVYDKQHLQRIKKHAKKTASSICTYQNLRQSLQYSQQMQQQNNQMNGGDVPMPTAPQGGLGPQPGFMQNNNNQPPAQTVKAPPPVRAPPPRNNNSWRPPGAGAVKAPSQVRAPPPTTQVRAPPAAQVRAPPPGRSGPPVQGQQPMNGVTQQQQQGTSQYGGLSASTEALMSSMAVPNGKP